MFFVFKKTHLKDSPKNMEMSEFGNYVPYYHFSDDTGERPSDGVCIEQLPAPYILMGDFNTHHPLWGGSHVDRNGRTIESLLKKHDLCLFKSPTYISPATGTHSALDLTICHSSWFLDYTWAVGDDQF